MRPVQCDIRNLSRKYLYALAIPICSDIAGLIAAIFIDMMREIHIDEVLSAQIMLAKTNTIHIILDNVDLYTGFEFHAVLVHAIVHEQSCNIPGIILGLCAVRDDFCIDIIPCHCHNAEILELCFDMDNNISYNVAKEILRIAYCHMLKVRIKAFGNASVQVFGRGK